MTDPDSDNLKEAAAYLVQVARSSKGGRFRKSAKIEALRECKDEILEAHRRGISIHRIAQIFRERKVDISTQHLMRAIRLFIKEEARGGGKSSSDQERPQGSAVAGEGKKASTVYQPSEQASPLVREEDFAKQLRLARYLAASSLPPSRALEPAANKTNCGKGESNFCKTANKGKVFRKSSKSCESKGSRSQTLKRCALSTRSRAKNERRGQGESTGSTGFFFLC